MLFDSASGKDLDRGGVLDRRASILAGQPCYMQSYRGTISFRSRGLSAVTGGSDLSRPLRRRRIPVLDSSHV